MRMADNVEFAGEERFGNVETVEENAAGRPDELSTMVLDRFFVADDGRPRVVLVSFVRLDGVTTRETFDQRQTGDDER